MFRKKMQQRPFLRIDTDDHEWYCRIMAFEQPQGWPGSYAEYLAIPCKNWATQWELLNAAARMYQGFAVQYADKMDPETLQRAKELGDEMHDFVMMTLQDERLKALTDEQSGVRDIDEEDSNAGAI